MSRTVLIVDYHPSFRATARMLLESEGWTVVGEAAGGMDGIEAARALGPDVVLLDVNLPDIDGFEVAERLTAGGEAGPAVVLVSSRDASDLGPRVSSCGACGFVAKADLSSDAVRELVA